MNSQTTTYTQSMLDTQPVMGIAKLRYGNERAISDHEIGLIMKKDPINMTDDEKL